MPSLPSIPTLCLIALSGCVSSFNYPATRPDCAFNLATLCNDGNCCAKLGVCVPNPLQAGTFSCCDFDTCGEKDPLGIANIPVPSQPSIPFEPPAVQQESSVSSGCGIQPDKQCTDGGNNAWYCPASQPICGKLVGLCLGSGPKCDPESETADDSDESFEESAAGTSGSSADDETENPEQLPSPNEGSSDPAESSPTPSSSDRGGDGGAAPSTSKGDSKDSSISGQPIPNSSSGDQGEVSSSTAPALAVTPNSSSPQAAEGTTPTTAKQAGVSTPVVTATATTAQTSGLQSQAGGRSSAPTTIETAATSATGSTGSARSTTASDGGASSLGRGCYGLVAALLFPFFGIV